MSQPVDCVLQVSITIKLTIKMSVFCRNSTHATHTFVLWTSGISQKSGALIVRHSQKKLKSFVFYCSENPSIAHSFGTTGPIQVGFSAKCTSPNEHFNQIENWKCHMFDFRLISLDHITNDDLLLIETHFISFLL